MGIKLFETEGEALAEYKKHKAPKELVYSPSIQNPETPYFVGWGDGVGSMIRVWERLIKSSY